MVARATCVMHYGRSCARTRNEAGCCTETEQKLPAQKQNRNYRSVVRTVPGNFLITYTVFSSLDASIYAM